MNRINAYAKIAWIAFPVLLFLQITLRHVQGPLANVLHFNLARLLILFNCIVYWALWIVLFILILMYATKRTPLMAPSLIALAGFALCLLAVGFSAGGQLFNSRLYDGYSPAIRIFFSASRWTQYLASIAIAVGLILLSRHVKKGSLLRALCLVIAILTLLDPIINYALSSWLYPTLMYDHKRLTIALKVNAVIWDFLSYIPAFLFFHGCSTPDAFIPESGQASRFPASA